MEIYNGNNTNRRSIVNVERDGEYQYNLIQTARILGVSRQRVLQLVECKLLDATYDPMFMHYRKWRISESSIQRRLEWMRSVRGELVA